MLWCILRTSNKCECSFIEISRHWLKMPDIFKLKPSIETCDLNIEYGKTESSFEWFVYKMELYWIFDCKLEFWENQNCM